MTPECPPFEALVDYLAGDLSTRDEQAVEEHYFGCARCTGRLQAVERLGRGVAAALRDGRLGVAVTVDELDRVTADGAVVRRYDVAPGGTVSCTASPADDIVAVCLSGPFVEAGRVRLERESVDLAGGDSGSDAVDVAVQGGRVVVLLPAEVVRGYARSRWTMYVSTPAARVGPYVFDHTPWDELDTTA